MTITLAELFKGHERALLAVMKAVGKGRVAKDIAIEHVGPILGHLETNAGTALDPTYVVYMVEFALTQKQSSGPCSP